MSFVKTGAGKAVFFFRARYDYLCSFVATTYDILKVYKALVKAVWNGIRHEHIICNLAMENIVRLCISNNLKCSKYFSIKVTMFQMTTHLLGMLHSSVS